MMTPSALLKLITERRNWPVMNRANYPGWDLMRELGSETRELVLDDATVLFIDGALLYHVGETGAVLNCYRLELCR